MSKTGPCRRLFHAVILERSEGSLYSARSGKNHKEPYIGEFTYVYILASGFKKLYIGVTSNLEARVWQHKNHTFPDSFTARYNIDQLVYFERFASMATAIVREKELKGWLRIKKITLIVANNPDWKDLSKEWGQPVEFWSEHIPSPPSDN